MYSTENGSVSEDPPSPHNICTSVAPNSSSNFNISEGLDEDDKKVLNILNGFLNTLDEASVSLQEHRNRLDTFIHQNTNVTNVVNMLSGYFCLETILNLTR